MYTPHAPKPVVAKLDYLSGDYSPTLSVDRARVEARYLASTGMPWDLLAWGFNWAEGLGQSLKPAIQLEQEAAVVLMQGGGFCIYYQPTRSGYIVPEIVQTTGDVADFCRARQKVSHKSRSVPQVALLLSSETQFDRSDAVFNPGGCVDELEGALHALLENHYCVDILAEHQLEPRLGEFPLVVIADSYKLSQDFKDSLRKYVDHGGNLLLLGQQCARLFAADLGVRFEGSPQNVKAELATAAGVVNENGIWQKVAPTTAEVVGHRYPTRDTRSGGEVAATLTSLGQREDYRRVRPGGDQQLPHAPPGPAAVRRGTRAKAVAGPCGPRRRPTLLGRRAAADGRRPVESPSAQYGRVAAGKPPRQRLHSVDRAHSGPGAGPRETEGRPLGPRW